MLAYQLSSGANLEIGRLFNNGFNGLFLITQLLFHFRAKCFYHVSEGSDSGDSTLIDVHDG